MTGVLTKLGLAMPDMLLTHKEGLAGNIDIVGSFGSKDYEMIAKLKILSKVRKINSESSSLEFRRADVVSLQMFCWQNPAEDCPAGPRGAS